MPSGIFTLRQLDQALAQGAWTGQKPLAVDYLVVAGGGGAGASSPGGGGAGGVLAGNLPVASGSAITVTIGSGGSGTSGSSAPGNGTNSVFGSITAIGGGKGENNAVAAGSGGSGGGAGASLLYGQGTAGQGNAGGSTYQASGGGASSGGGGAGNVGESPVIYNAGGAGGAGVGSYLSGTLTGYGGGGAGSTGNTGTGFSTPETAYGGGGATANPNGGSGSANTGGGGAAAPSYTGGNGGSGIVIISYPDTYAAAASTTGSPTVSTSGSGSILFNGSTQILIFNSNSAFQFGTGSFTWETWVYINTSGDNGLFDLGSLNTSGSFGVFIATNTIFVRIDGSSNDLTYVVPGGMPTGTWVHLAVVRSGTTLTLYYNGTSVTSGTRTNNVTQSTPYIGGLNGISAYALKGQLSNTRVVKGSAVYTGNFTPSTSPLTAITNTSLLLNTVSGAYLADSSSNGFAPNTGTIAPTWSQLSPFATGLGYKNRVYTWTSSGSITF